MLTNKTHTNPFSATLLVKAILCITIFSFFFPFVSGAEWDNDLDYENNDMKVVITNWLGFGERLGEATLTSHKTADEVRNVIRGEDRVVMYYDFNFDEIYENGLGEVSFVNMRTGKEINRDYHFVYEDPIPFEVPVLKKECIELGNKSQLCESVIDYYDTRYRSEWKEFNGKDIPKGNIRIGLATDVNKGDYIDAVWTIAGKKISRHATWTDALNVDLYKYYNFTNEDEWVSGSPDLVAHQGVMTFNSSGLIGNAGNCNDTDNFNITDDNTVMALDAESALNFWVQPRTLLNAEGLIRKTNSAFNQGWGFHQLAGGGLRAGIEWSNTDFAGVLTVDTWTMITVSRNTTETCLWADAVLQGCMDAQVSGSPDLAVIVGGGTAWSGSDYDGLFDEMGWWSRSLTDAEITQLYNGGAGITVKANALSALSVTIEVPTDNFKTINDTLTFNSTLTPINANLTNATYHVWYSNSSIINITTILAYGVSTANVSSLDITNLPFGTHIWNAFGCAENGTDTLCAWDTNNFTFTRQQFAVDSTAFSGNVKETDNERYEVNITTIDTILSVSSILYYENTSHLANSICSEDGECNIYVDIDVPLVNSGSDTENKTFFWEISIFDGTDNLRANTTDLQQNVSRIHLEKCDATYTTQTLNFTAYDEADFSRIDEFYFAGDFSFWLGTGDVKRNNSFSNTTAIDVPLCMSPSGVDFTTDAIIEYNDEQNSTTYNTRNYFFQEDEITDISQDIELYLLKSDDSTSFILKVQDINLLPVEDALIIIQKFNPGTGNFTTISIARTDGNGQTVGFFKTETVDYRFVIVKNGETLLTTVAGKVVPESAPFTLIFTVGDSEDSPWSSFEDLPNLEKTLTFDSSTGNVSFSYIDSSGEFNLGRLILYGNNLSGISETLCDINTTLSSATLVCGTGNVSGTYTASALITRGSETYLVSQIIFTIQTFSDVAGLLGVFLAWFVILISAFAFKFNEIAGIVLMNITVILVNLIGLVNFGFLFIFGMIAVSLLIIVQLER